MRWQDKAASVTAVQNRISEYWFPLHKETLKHENVKLYNSENHGNY